MVLVILMVSIISSIVSTIVALLAADEEENKDKGAASVTYLHVRVTQDGNAVEGLDVTLSPIEEDEESSKMKLTFGKTDATGEAKVVLPGGGGTGGLTYSTGNDAYYGITNGIPTKHCTLLAKGNVSYYDTYSYVEADDTGYKHSYNLNKDIPAKAGFAMVENCFQKEPGSPSDSYHVGAVVDSCDEQTIKAQRKTGNLLYVYDDADGGAYSYGACITIDVGGGADYNPLLDLYFPFNKYYGKYGISEQTTDDLGSNTTGWGKDKWSTGVQKVVHPYLQNNVGITNPASAVSSWTEGDHNSVYLLDDSEDLVDGQKRSTYLRSLIVNHDYWPTEVTGGSGGSGSSLAEKYSLIYTETYTAVDPFAEIPLASCRTTEENAYTITDSSNSTSTELQFEFWTTTESAGSSFTGSVEADLYSAQYIWNQSSYNGVKGINVFKADTRNGAWAEYFPGSALANCTSWVWGRVYDTHGGLMLKGGGWPGNPAQNNSGVLTKTSTPQAGDIACWSGHVAFIESIDGQTVTLSESGKTFYKNTGKPYVTNTLSVSDIPSHNPSSWNGYYHVNG